MVYEKERTEAALEIAEAYAKLDTLAQHLEVLDALLVGCAEYEDAHKYAQRASAVYRAQAILQPIMEAMGNE